MFLLHRLTISLHMSELILCNAVLCSDCIYGCTHNRDSKVKLKNPFQLLPHISYLYYFDKNDG